MSSIVYLQESHMSPSMPSNPGPTIGPTIGSTIGPTHPHPHEALNPEISTRFTHDLEGVKHYRNALESAPDCPVTITRISHPSHPCHPCHPSASPRGPKSPNQYQIYTRFGGGKTLQKYTRIGTKLSSNVCTPADPHLRTLSPTRMSPPLDSVYRGRAG